MRELLKNRYFQLSFISICYGLWVLWLDNYWFFSGYLIIIEIYFIKKINWRFWYKKNTPYKFKHELADTFVLALFLAIFIRTFFLEVFVIPTESMEKTLMTGDFIFVSKLHYGPRMPVTPLGIPFTHNTIPGTKTKSYLSFLKLPLKRLGGFRDIKRNDVLVFNLPVGDTVMASNPQQDYYQLKRKKSYDFNANNIKKHYHPIDKRDYYIKRCLGLPGDTLFIKQGKVFINKKYYTDPKKLQHTYYVKTNDKEIPDDKLKELGVWKGDINLNKATWLYEMPLTENMARELAKYDGVQGIRKQEKVEASVFNYTIFPYSNFYLWTEDNYGPVIIPKKNDTVMLNARNICLYERIIETYEKNKPEVKNDKVFINGKQTDKYVFKKDYYFVIGDNRHNSFDSRYWGFVPFDHIVGKAIFVWFSVDRHETGLRKIRWKQLFKIIR